MGRRGRVLRKAVKAALMQLRIGDWAALFAHSCLPKAPIGFEEPIVTLALNDILSRSVAARCRVSRQGKERSQADSQENLARSSFEAHDERLHTLDLPETFEKALSSEDIMPHTSTLIAFPHNNLRSGRPRRRLILAYLEHAAGRLNLGASASPRNEGARERRIGEIERNRVVQHPAYPRRRHRPAIEAVAVQ
jgi:hypothetical protein